MDNWVEKNVCPICGSKKISIDQDDSKHCNIGNQEWENSTGKRVDKKGRVRYRWANFSGGHSDAESIEKLGYLAKYL